MDSPFRRGRLPAATESRRQRVDRRRRYGIERSAVEERVDCETLVLAQRELEDLQILTHVSA